MHTEYVCIATRDRMRAYVSTPLHDCTYICCAADDLVRISTDTRMLSPLYMVYEVGSIDTSSEEATSVETRKKSFAGTTWSMHSQRDLTRATSRTAGRPSVTTYNDKIDDGGRMTFPRQHGNPSLHTAAETCSLVSWQGRIRIHSRPSKSFWASLRR